MFDRIKLAQGPHRLSADGCSPGRARCVSVESIAEAAHVRPAPGMASRALGRPTTFMRRTTWTAVAVRSRPSGSCRGPSRREALRRPGRRVARRCPSRSSRRWPAPKLLDPVRYRHAARRRRSVTARLILGDRGHGARHSPQIAAAACCTTSGCATSRPGWWRTPDSLHGEDAVDDRGRTRSSAPTSWRLAAREPPGGGGGAGAPLARRAGASRLCAERAVADAPRWWRWPSAFAALTQVAPTAPSPIEARGAADHAGCRGGRPGTPIPIAVKLLVHALRGGGGAR